MVADRKLSEAELFQVVGAGGSSMNLKNGKKHFGKS